MCGQPTAYNAYATLPYTNPLFMGFSRSQNVKKEIAEIKIDKTQAGKTVEEIEETDFVSIYLIFRDDLSILPQKDTMLKLNDIIIIRDGN